MTDLSRRIAWTTAAAWSLGVAVLAALSIGLHHQGRETELDGLLMAHAIAAYGLTWFQDDGFHAELLEMEELDPRVSVTVATPQGVVYGPPHALAQELTAQAMETQDEVWRDHAGVRTVALPSYDADDVTVVGAVLASAALERSPTFAVGVLAGSGLFLGVGLVLSRALAARVLRSEQDALAERERILAGAAHELRTPLATLGAQLDSGAAPTEVRHTVTEAAEMVDRLLTWSRLAHADIQREPVRLDLLVEVCLDPDDPLDAQECVVHGDARLLKVAVTNLVQNARRHGGGLRQVRVADGRVEVLDHGPGIADARVRAPFIKGPTSPGTGLGLALVDRIAQRHGGELVLQPAIALQLTPAL